MSKRRHRVLVVGVGSIGERHLRCFLATGRAEVSLCEINPALRDAVGERYGVERRYDSLDAALADPPQAAVIAVPAHLHIPMAIRLAEAGLHLLVEKPLSTSLDQVDVLQKAVDSKDVVAAVAYVYRMHPALRAMKQAIAGGRFGKPVQIYVTSGQPLPLYRPAYREIYYKDRASGGGAIQDALTHFINAGQWLVGPVQRLVADAGHQVLEGVQVEDTVHMLARHDDGVLGSYALNQHQAPNESTFTVVCQRGAARFEYHRACWSWATEPGGPWNEEPPTSLERDTLFTAQANSFLDAVEGRDAPACTLSEGVHTLRCNLAALASLESGAWQTVGFDLC